VVTGHLDCSSSRSLKTNKGVLQLSFTEDFYSISTLSCEQGFCLTPQSHMTYTVCNTVKFGCPLHE